MKNSLVNIIDNVKQKNENLENIVDNIVDYLKNKKVIIYGAGASGKAIFHCLNEYNIVTACFLDQKAEEIRNICEIDVLLPEKMGDIHGQIVVINSIDPQLFKATIDIVKKNVETYLPDADYVSYGRDLLYLLKRNICKNEIEDGHSLDIFDCINCGAESRGCQIFEKFLKDRYYTEERTGLKNKFNKFFGYICGQVCTLRCINCCECIPAYKERDLVPKDIILKDCKRLAEASEFNLYVELVGGEPFLHPELDLILDGLLKLPNVGYIKVFTNGTVPPSENLVKILKNKRLIIVWSNYMDAVKGKLKEKIIETRKIFEENNIRYIYSYSQTWLDFAPNFKKINKSEEDLRKDFTACHLANCHRLYRGRLYRCPHNYAGDLTGQCKLKKSDVVDIYDMDTIEALSEQLYEFKNMEYTSGCKYCTLPYDSNEVPAAEQEEF